MKKIAILTINDNSNFGNRLQNYALQIFLEKNGINVETIQNIINCYNKNYIHNLVLVLKDFLKKFSPLIKHKRYLKFKKFNKKVKHSLIKIDLNHIDTNLNSKYDYFITGSDQVWNPNFGRLSHIDLLSFVNPNKRISYAASFGIEELPEEYIKRTKIELEKFKAISVREDSGKEIVEKLTNRKDVEVLIDPTMLLSAEEWDKVSKKPKNLKNNRYILNYFLGNLSDERKKEINRIAKENNCNVINILDNSDPFYTSGPSEFLYLEKHAFLICTDSFHSSVFAILYNRPFVIFDREDNIEKMNSRIDTLLSKFKLKDRKFEGKITDKNLNHDYIEAYKILEEERIKSNNYLKNALDIID